MATIDLMICVDSKKVVDAGPGPGQTSPEKPGGCDHSWAFMITDVAHAVQGSNGTADLELQARSGDTIRITSSSLSNQLDYAVFVYDFQHWKGEKGVLDTAGMKNRTITGLAAIPTPDQADHEPPTVTFQEQPFYIEQIDVNSRGKEWFMVTFVVYGEPTVSDPNKRPVLGYYRWDPSINAV